MKKNEWMKSEAVSKYALKNSKELFVEWFANYNSGLYSSGKYAELAQMAKKIVIK